MHLKAFEVRNYRAFVEPARVELRPLTLLFGYNNAGKSALARVLPLLRDSARLRRGAPLDLESMAVRGASFSDLRSKQTGRRSIELGLEWGNSPFLSRSDLVLQDFPEHRSHFVEALIVTGDGGALELRLKKFRALGDSSYTLRSDGGTEDLEIGWMRLYPTFDADAARRAPKTINLGAYATAIETLSSLLWIGAVRASPRRLEMLPKLRPESIEWDGTGAADLLAWDKRHGSGEIFSLVSQWYRDHARAPLELVFEAGQYALTTGKQQVNLCDMGEGLAEVLPVLVAEALAERRSVGGEPATFVVEQPELHLHPAAHADLAGFFCRRAAAASPPNVLIETHSENFLFGVQLAVARGELDPSRVMIYWVHQDAEGYSTLRPIQLDAAGRPDNWPMGVFTEEIELAKQLIDIRRARNDP